MKTTFTICTLLVFLGIQNLGFSTGSTWADDIGNDRVNLGPLTPAPNGSWQNGIFMTIMLINSIGLLFARKLCTFFLFSMIALSSCAQNFGEFGSAVYMSECYLTQFYNTTGSGANCINPSCATVFDGKDFGSYSQNSGQLSLGGAEIKSWKNGGGNVCSGTLYYRIYPAGSPSGAFSSFNIPWKCNCCGSNFCDGIGPCGGNDQKWSTLAQSIDLTTYPPGDYEIEVYFSYTGDDNSSWNCNDTKYINNGGSNYIASYTVVSPGSGSCNVLAAELHTFIALCHDDYTELICEFTPDHETAFLSLEKSTNGVDWTEVYQSDHLIDGSNQGSFQFIDNSTKNSNITYYRLIESTINGQLILLQTLSTNCTSGLSEISAIYNQQQGQVVIQVNGMNSQDRLECEILDYRGRRVYSEVIEHYGGNNAIYHLIGSNELASGIYLMKINSSIQNYKPVRVLIP